MREFSQKIDIAALKLESSGVIVDYLLVEAIKPMPLNRLNHVRNLCGGHGFDGLTGRWHGIFYDKGYPRTR